MTTNYPNNQSHPEELLDAYVLNALDEEEMVQVEAHLEDCVQCRETVAELQRATTRLGMSVARQEAPGGLLTRIMGALEPVAPTYAPAKEVRASFWSWSRTFSILAPIAAAVVVALFSVSVVMNVRISDRTEVLEQENATLTAQLAQSAQVESQAVEQVAETVQQLRTTNYWLANPTNQSVTLEPPGGAGESRGVLLVSSDGRRAMLLLSGMTKPSPSSSYEVWLIRHGNRWWAGEVEVDDGGWGTATLLPRESVFGFEKVELTAEMAPGDSPGPGDMVLEAEIPSLQPSHKVTLLGWQ